jgi:hypothetical protein
MPSSVSVRQAIVLRDASQKADVSNYIGRVSVRPVTEGGGTFVEWSSTWERNDEAIAEFCHSIYVALLADMKKSLEC